MNSICGIFCRAAVIDRDHLKYYARDESSQYMISTKETMLKPRKRPKSPPSEAMKSTGPILMLLSNSKRRSNFMLVRCALSTHDSFLAKKDIDNSNVLLPGVVEVPL